MYIKLEITDASFFTFEPETNSKNQSALETLQRIEIILEKHLVCSNDDSLTHNDLKAIACEIYEGFKSKVERLCFINQRLGATGAKLHEITQVFHRIQGTPSLSNLPLELKEEIFHSLSTPDLLKLASTSRLFYTDVNWVIVDRANQYGFATNDAYIAKENIVSLYIAILLIKDLIPKQCIAKRSHWKVDPEQTFQNILQLEKLQHKFFCHSLCMRWCNLFTDPIHKTHFPTTFIGQNIEQIQALYTLGVNPNLKNKNGEAALHVASRVGDVLAVTFLLKARSNPNIQNSRGNTPLGNAAFKGHVDVIHILLQAKALPDPLNNVGETPIMSAAYNGHLSAVKALIEGKADLNHQDTLGNTAHGLALQEGKMAVAALLFQAGVALKI